MLRPEQLTYNYLEILCVYHEEYLSYILNALIIYIKDKIKTILNNL